MFGRIFHSKGSRDTDASTNASAGRDLFMQATAAPNQRVESQQLVPMAQKMAELKAMFTDWEETALLDVLRANESDVNKAIDTIFSSVDIPVEPAVASWALPDAHLPELLHRSKYDEAMGARLVRHITPSQFCGATMKAIAVFKRRAASARQHVSEYHRTTTLAHGQQLLHTMPCARMQLSREDQIMAGRALLAQRLQHLKLQPVVMEDDGNCQFRAVSQELFGTQDFHQQIRGRAVAYMRTNSARFRDFFIDNEYETYLAKMATPRCWGDELTLQAVADAFTIKIHLITSTADNWYLHYDPTDDTTAVIRECFITYISPIHYNTVAPEAPPLPTIEPQGLVVRGSNATFYQLRREAV
jgi:hypothetical protein